MRYLRSDEGNSYVEVQDRQRLHAAKPEIYAMHPYGKIRTTEYASNSIQARCTWVPSARKRTASRKSSSDEIHAEIPKRGTWQISLKNHLKFHSNLPAEMQKNLPNACSDCAYQIDSDFDGLVFADADHFLLLLKESHSFDANNDNYQHFNEWIFIPDTF
jgi:hypothetical protein